MTQSQNPVAGIAKEPDEASLSAGGPARVRKGRRPRVCLVTTEFHGLFKNGGIGTANTGLAHAFAAAGFEVTVAFADADRDGPRVKEGNFFALQEQYRRSGIHLDFVPASPFIEKAFDDPRSASYCVYLYLKQHEFDVVYFNDCGGQGFYSLLAKRVGVFQNAPRMYVVAHGPQEWVLELNSLRYWGRAPVITAWLERRSAALADALISPSQYLIDWMIAHDWIMPPEIRVIQNIVPVPDSVEPLTPRLKTTAISELVFFGRLEVRKGIEQFCDAIDLLNQSIDLSTVRTTFLGKFAHIAGAHSGIYVIERARRWRSSLRILSTYGQDEALSHLSRPGVLAVMPSHAENSPCAVVECLELGVPFVATESGGTAELIAPEDREDCLIAPGAEALAKKLERILQAGHHPASLAAPQAFWLEQWLRLTDPEPAESGDDGAPGHPDASERPPWSGTGTQFTVSVCLTSSSLSRAAQPLIDSLLRQNYPNLELLLFDDNPNGDRPSLAHEAIGADGTQRPCRIPSGAAADRGAQRNAAAKQSRGDYLLFVEEDCTALTPECVETLVKAALRTGADIVTAVPLLNRGNADGTQEGKLEYFPVGGCAELGGLENCFGCGAYLVARESFERCGGFPAPCNAEIEDWLFLATSVLAGLHLEVVPEPLFAYRKRFSSPFDRSHAVDNHRRILAAYRAQKMEMFEHLIESVAQADPPRSERARGTFETLSGEAREIALRVSSSYEPNNDHSLRGLVQFCVERHKVQEAFDFALHNGRRFLSDVLGSAKQLAETLSLDAVRGHTLDLWHEVPLNDDVRSRIKSVSPFPAKDLVQPDDGMASYTIDWGTTILKAAAVCPPHTRCVRAVARVECSAPMPVSLALVVTAPNARLRLSEQGLQSKEAFWWSDWISPPNGSERIELTVPVLEPMAGLLDLHFLCRMQHGDGPLVTGKITWESAGATIAVNGVVTASSIKMTYSERPIPRDVIDRGILMTQDADFPFPVFVPGDHTLLHPLPGRVALVRLCGAVPPGSKGVRSVVSLELAASHPVQFAVWIRSASAPAACEAEFTPADTFSGWLEVKDKFRRHSFSVHLREPAGEAMDLYLGTRVVEFPDVHYCHAAWHELLIIE